MLDPLIAFFTSANGQFWITLSNDTCIALACFAISIAMAVTLRHRRNDVPHPWLGRLLVLFIAACGLTHAAEALSAVMDSDYAWLQAPINVFCAITSVCTALAFAFILPRIKLLPSPTQQRAALEKLVSERTGEKDQLIREINHRIGNQLQIISSMLNVENRKTDNKEVLDILGRLKIELGKMAHEHLERSKVDYLRYGVRASDGTVTAVDDGEAKPGALTA
jgi:hypothetical protein